MLANRLQEKIAGVCLIAGVLLMAPVTFCEYAQGTRFMAGALGLFLYALLLPGLLGVARLLREAAPRLSVVAGLLATFGCVSGATFQTAILHEWAARAAGTPEAQVTAIMAVTEERVFPVLVTLGILFPVSLVTLGVGLLRTGAAPGWAAALLVIGAIAFPVGHIGSIQLVSHAAETLMLIPLIWIGLRFLTSPSTRGVTVPAMA
jgi:hypothetical protein